MKKHLKVMFALGFTAMIAAPTAFGQFVITFDEFGNGDYNGTPMTWSMMLDPWSGMTTLAYQLPFAGVGGDIVLDEPPVPPGSHSDLLRFDGSGNLFVFSDFSAGSTTDPADSPADVGLPAPNALGLPVLSFTESGSEGGLQGLFGYTPGFSDPGANSAGVIYNFISDVPEPGSVPLLVCGLGIFALAMRRRKLARA
jgi:hypothetical protein